MNDDELRRIESVFQGAADLPAGERAAYVERACAGDQALRARVEALLIELDSGDSLPIPAAAWGAGDGGEATVLEGPGTVIGRYKLLQRIGEGGFGVVYMAEQEQPIVRRVALKIIKLGMDTKEVVARFEAERQALALMDHPNIARVLDGGATDSGRPFFVMELVRGVSITEYCDEHGLSTRVRLELFVDVCHAVQHAHQKGVIHRDLKPSNVLVTHHDGCPVVKVIDFGVAKAMHSRLTEKTLFTAFGRFIGTPAYMSPEQAELSGLDVDTRTDIYSLGVLLYELLTGTTPFDIRDLLEGGLVAVQRTIKEQPPERPSLRISTSGSAAIARRRGTDVPALSRLLRGDLDWIVMKCLEKERVRRYETASELAADIGRHLDHEAVLAGPPSTAYRLRKFLARNRAAALSVAVVLLGVLLGLVGLTLGMLEARAEQELALGEARRTKAVTDFLIDTISLSDPRVALQPDLSIATFLSTVSEKASVVFVDRPEAEARLFIAVGRGYKGLGEYERAATHLRRGIDLARALPGHDKGQVYEAMWDLVHVLFYVEDPNALAYAMETRAVAHEHIGARYPEVVEVLGRFVDMVNEASFSLDAEAIRRIPGLFAETVAVTDRIPAGDPLWPILAEEWISAGYSLWYGVLDPLTVDLFGRAAQVMGRELPANDPTLAETLGLYVHALNRNGRAEEAEHEIRELVDRMRTVLPPKNPQLVQIEAMLGETLLLRGLHVDAEPLLLTAYESMRDAADGDVANFFVTEETIKLLRLYDGWGRPEKAAPYREELRGVCARSRVTMLWPHVRLAFGPELEDLLLAMDPIQEHLGGVHRVSRPPSVPEDEVREALAAVVASARARLRADETLWTVFLRQLLQWCGSMMGSTDFRRALVSECLDGLDPWRESFPPEVAAGHAQLAEILLAQGEREAAVREALEAHRMLVGRQGDWMLATTRVRVAMPLLSLGLHAEAEESLRVGYEGLRLHFGDGNADVELARALRVENLTAWGKPEEARGLAR